MHTPATNTLLAITAAAGALLLNATTARAEIPEPDNLLYGTIMLDSQIVTAARTNVVIEARRTPDGVPIASYRMGANSQIGNFYLLRLALESVSPVAHTNASEVGNSVHIIVREGAAVRGQTTYIFPERGNVQRTDFGTPSGDSDGDGLPDAWEVANFGSLNQNPNTINANGQTTLNNFTAGSNPNDANTLFQVNISNSGSQRWFRSWPGEQMVPATKDARGTIPWNPPPIPHHGRAWQASQISLATIKRLPSKARRPARPCSIAAKSGCRVRDHAAGLAQPCPHAGEKFSCHDNPPS